MKYLDSTRSEKLAKGLEFFLKYTKIVTIIGIAISFIYMIVSTVQSSQYGYSSGRSVFFGWVMYILGLALTILVIQILLWFIKMFWNGFIALVESAEHTIAHIQEMHRDGKFIQTNNNPSQTNNDNQN